MLSFLESDILFQRKISTKILVDFWIFRNIFTGLSLNWDAEVTWSESCNLKNIYSLIIFIIMYILIPAASTIYWYFQTEGN